MRKIINDQMQLGEIDISLVEINFNSRDEIPQLLLGLKHIYTTEPIRKKVFKLLKGIIPKNVDSQNGRKGMDLWNIFVLGTLKLNCNWDYDKLQDIADNHQTLRQILGHGILDEYKRYPAQTLRDNISWFTPKILDKINKIVVDAGYNFLGKTTTESVHGKCDSFVVETDVHFPTDINLLFDAIRKILLLTWRLCDMLGISRWRQTPHNLKNIKKLFRRAQKLKDSKSKKKKEKIIQSAFKEYVDTVERFVNRAQEEISIIEISSELIECKLNEIDHYVKHAKRQIDQIRRRVLEGEKIAHEEKLFSIFEEHTEWICKGKAGIIAELGLNVCILKDDLGFILHHHVMENETDDKVAVPMVMETKKRYPGLETCSFDKGFYSPENQLELQKELRLCVLPKKGKISKEEIKSIPEEFIERRRKHSAVESSINALENHGLDRCLDKGIDGFKRYVSLAVVARNIQILGVYIRKKELEKEKKLKKRKCIKTHLEAA
ncbi:MAG: ISNCY family transposase [archaeon]|nr:ISNCY family transposase [archaeon]